jgi:hypothetical protein
MSSHLVCDFEQMLRGAGSGHGEGNGAHAMVGRMYGAHDQTEMFERAEDSRCTGCAEVQDLTQTLDAMRSIKIQCNEAVNFLGFEAGGVSNQLVSSSTQGGQANHSFSDIEMRSFHSPYDSI